MHQGVQLGTCLPTALPTRPQSRQAASNSRCRWQATPPPPLSAPAALPGAARCSTVGEGCRGPQGQASRSAPALAAERAAPAPPPTRQPGCSCCPLPQRRCPQRQLPRRLPRQRCGQPRAARAAPAAPPPIGSPLAGPCSRWRLRPPAAAQRRRGRWPLPRAALHMRGGGGAGGHAAAALSALARKQASVPFTGQRQTQQAAALGTLCSPTCAAQQVHPIHQAAPQQHAQRQAGSGAARGVASRVASRRLWQLHRQGQPAGLDHFLQIGHDALQAGRDTGQVESGAW